MTETLITPVTNENIKLKEKSSNANLETEQLTIRVFHITKQTRRKN